MFLGGGPVGRSPTAPEPRVAPLYEEHAAFAPPELRATGHKATADAEQSIDKHLHRGLE
jgi:hypothetical protein